jgi:hypothetical protein
MTLELHAVVEPFCDHEMQPGRDDGARRFFMG